ncbi:ATP-dependent DNA helicase CHL1 [Labeo rohita]|uniref:ATP-dependent DNA helicase CHL1 n=1 Tax=Labeo rohita TaxID=84645 RepID=A0ABQ8N328_LABRO|nr:ATP-dependent DNA helicase CHL1 [Labeo rohita]
MLGFKLAASSVIPLGLLYMRPLQYWLKPVSSPIPGAWAGFISGCPVGTDLQSKVVMIDASNLGWGALLEGNPVFDSWSSLEQSLHINCLEIRAAFLALKTFLPAFKGAVHVLDRLNQGVDVLSRGNAAPTTSSDGSNDLVCLREGRNHQMCQGSQMLGLLGDPTLDEPSMVPRVDSAAICSLLANTIYEGHSLASKGHDLTPPARASYGTRGQTHSTLKDNVAIITATHSLEAGQSIGRNNLAIKFLKGTQRLNMPRPHRTVSRVPSHSAQYGPSECMLRGLVCSTTQSSFLYALEATLKGCQL